MLVKQSPEVNTIYSSCWPNFVAVIAVAVPHITTSWILWWTQSVAKVVQPHTHSGALVVRMLNESSSTTTSPPWFS